MFEHNFANRSKACKISVHDVFDDIKLTAGGDELAEQGYITLDYENRELKLKYMVKPSKSVIDLMVESGRGLPGKVEINLLNEVLFYSYWDTTYGKFETTPRIAGIVEQNELIEFKKSAEYVGYCLVNKAYKDLLKAHPLYNIRSASEPLGSDLKDLQNRAKLVWVAVGYALNNKKFIECAERGDFNNFYLDQSRLDFLRDKFNVDVRDVDPEKQIKTKKPDGLEL
ncbi:hypothetical protein [Vibrio metschnikovii]|uniref:Uncharacterized protein n=1 Tax=Vibrio metschnikovii TaxID=28172 RepID=A0A9X0UKS0_VIBME|nr:hypothetical protein [Vibrio metschnikovii]MBC5853176.1 hypothetical protein [Vibrio metschnikovii]